MSQRSGTRVAPDGPEMDPNAAQLVLGRRVYACHPYRGTAVDALLVRGGRVLAVGTRRRLRTIAPRGARKLDLGDAWITPGLTDAHTHFFYWALMDGCVVDVQNTRSLAEAQQRLRRERRPVRGWVLGRGFDVNVWGGGFPSARELDAAVPDAPCMVRSRDGHVAWLNTAGLHAAGITRRTPDPPGGRYSRDSSGQPDGIVLEAALDALPNPLAALANSAAPEDQRIVEAALTRATGIARRLGFTGVHVLDDAASIRTFQRLRRSGARGLRIAHSVPFDLRAQVYATGLGSGIGDSWFRLAAIKIFSDGTLGSQTALMLDDYPARPGYRGVGVVHGEALREAVREAVGQGWCVWVHAIGDGAVRETIDAIESATRAGAGAGGGRSRSERAVTRLSSSARRTVRAHASLPPHRIEHAQCTRPADVRRMARLGIVASVQPCHLIGDIATADRHWPDARRFAFPLASLRDAGVTLAMGSDVPVESIDPRRSFHAAIRRQDETAAPQRGWFPRERITAVDVLRGFTQGAAESLGDPSPAGTLMPGAPADLTLWGTDPFRRADGDWLEMPILGSILADEL
ncbi:MAG: amidohydrolase [Planctomycetia bacterium]|nr:MAG: amidohydrolase [Planctomycetia bacterium]